MLAAAFALMSVVPAAAQVGETRVTAIGPGYEAGAVHQWLLGRHYRKLWTTPLPIEVLDLGRFAGGLTPLRAGGGMQTRSLRFAGADGRQYVFRSVDKDPSPTVPPVLRQTAAVRVMQDQISSAHPAGPLVVSPLLEAVGVLHAEPRLVIMPDASALGEFRDAFAGVIGMIEERPAETDDEAVAFAGARRLEGTDDLLDILEKEPGAEVDVRAFLAARLMDLFLGDWDRHVDQWRWALVEQGDRALWTPIPRDRDQAFARLDGVLPWVARQIVPQFVDFGPAYPSIEKLTWSGRVLDRRLLPRLDRPVWDSVATRLSRQLTDRVIENAVSRLPSAYAPYDSARLASALRRRRDALPEAAARFYRLLAEEVDVHGTDAAEVLRVDRVDRRYLDVRITATNGNETFHRRFAADETREVRVYLHGGADRALVTGAAANPICIRIVGGGGPERLADSTRAGGVRFYDDAGSATALGPGSRLDTRPHERPQSWGSGESPRDFGTRFQWRPWFGVGADVGVLAGVRADHTRYGFGNLPYARRLTLQVGWAAGADAWRAELDGEWRREHTGQAWHLGARASGIEVLHFYGYGNETAAGPRDDFRVRQQQYRASPGYSWRPEAGLRLELGAVLAYTRTRLDSGTFVAESPPPGTDPFLQVGVRAGLEADRRDRATAASSGYRVRLDAAAFPRAGDVRTPYGEVHGEGSLFLTPGPPSRPTLALRVGGRKVWGAAPLHDAALLGGATNMRGFSEPRFAGDAMAFGNAELRVPVSRFQAVLPGELGLLGFADGGRVWWRGEQSDRWHGAAGGGIWFAFLDRAGTVALTLANGTERTTFGLRAGFAY